MSLSYFVYTQPGSLADFISEEETREKLPELKDFHCNKLESVREELERKSGKRVRFQHVDTKNKCGKVYIGNELKDLEMWAINKLKSLPTLTEFHCKHLEELRLAIEVYSGKRVIISCLDVKRGRGQIFLENESTKVAFCYELGLIDFAFSCEKNSPRHIAKFDNPGLVRIITDIGSDASWIVGSCLSVRKEEPFYNRN